MGKSSPFLFFELIWGLISAYVGFFRWALKPRRSEDEQRKATILGWVGCIVSVAITWGAYSALMNHESSGAYIDLAALGKMIAAMILLPLGGLTAILFFFVAIGGYEARRDFPDDWRKIKAPEND